MKKLRKHAALGLLALLAAALLSGCALMGGVETGPEKTDAPMETGKSEKPSLPDKL